MEILAIITFGSPNTPNAPNSTRLIISSFPRLCPFFACNKKCSPSYSALVDTNASTVSKNPIQISDVLCGINDRRNAVSTPTAAHSNIAACPMRTVRFRFSNKSTAKITANIAIALLSTFSIGNTVIIPRITLIPTDNFEPSSV